MIQTAVPLPPELSSAVDRFDHWVLQHLKLIERRELIKAPLYHYTDEAGAVGIIGTGVIRFGDYRAMNDKSELRYGMKSARRVLREIAAVEDGRAAMFLRMVEDLLSSKNMRSLEFYVACFTRDRDDLSQWRAYGDDGKGFAIGLAPRLFHPDPVHVSKLGEGFVAAPVYYESTAVALRHSEPALVAKSIFLEAADEHRDLLAERSIGLPFMREMALRLLASEVVWNCLTTKHPAYAGEREVRAAIMGPAGSLNPFLVPVKRGRRLSHRIDHPMLAGDSGAIVEVVAGPAAAKASIQKVRQALDAFRQTPTIKIRRSQIPYRARWSS